MSCASCEQLSDMVSPNNSRPATLVTAAGIALISQPAKSVLSVPVKTGGVLSTTLTVILQGVLGQLFAVVIKETVYVLQALSTITFTLDPVDEPLMVALPVTVHWYE